LQNLKKVLADNQSVDQDKLLKLASELDAAKQQLTESESDVKGLRDQLSHAD
jgi:hypothetical protein